MESKLQIISGARRGLKLMLPYGARPTQNRARLAICNILQPMIENQIVIWDAFAGSGALAFEFLSRDWAVKAIFTDTSSESIKSVRSNAIGFDKNKIIIEQSDALSVVNKFAPEVDIVFVDPPYTETELGLKFVKKFISVAKPGSIIVWEIESDKEIDVSEFEILKDKTYGRARFLIFRKN